MKKNSFMEGAIIATLAIFISKLMGVLYVIPFHGLIGEQGGALYGYAYNIYNVFLIISVAGIPLGISKITSEYLAKGNLEKKAEMFIVAKNIIKIFSFVSFIVLFILAKPISHLILGEISKGNTVFDVTFVIRCVAFSLLIVPLLSIERGYLQGHNYIAPASFSQVIEQTIRIIIILVGSYLAIRIFHWPLRIAVGISMLAASIGALIAYFYLLIKNRKIRKDEVKVKDISKEDRNEIIRKIFTYSLPFIIVNITNSLYNTTDMILLNRGLHLIGFNDIDIETISSVFTTWGHKILSIVTAIATGLIISLIPTLVKAYVNKDNEKTNYYFNKALQVLLFIILPLTIFISIYAKEVWTIFYSNNYYGPIILRFTILIAFFDSANITICSALQGLYKTKLIYLSEIVGFVINLSLDIPLILLFNKLGIYPYYGAILATLIGYLISHSIPLIYLMKKDNFSYKTTLSKIPFLLISIVLLIIINLLYHHYMPPFNGRFNQIFYLMIIGIISLIIYYLLNRKTIKELLIEKTKKM